MTSALHNDRLANVAGTSGDQLLGVVLAGGRSTRMGTDKAALPVTPQTEAAFEAAIEAAVDGHSSADIARPETLLMLAVRRIRPLVTAIAVSGRSDQQLNSLAPAGELGSPPPLGIVDPLPDLGPAMGVCESLRTARSLGLAAIIVTPVDMPDLRTEDLRHLVDAYRTGPRLIAAKFADGRPQPLVAIYPVDLIESIENLLATPHRSLYRYLQERNASLVRLRRSASRNLNRPQDLGDRVTDAG
ncbi:MAG: molybdenum cofactor guanylyltransferase [Planctomycetaceae bacterium]|nr:MAG: molybdenum cofactor guanylyltransferase [Planctomycetaceae bacterium]